MEAVFYILGLFIVKHFLIDFVLQPREMAVGKGNSWTILLIHTAMNGLATLLLLTAISATLYPIAAMLILWLAFLDFILHTIIDKISTQCYKRLNLSPSTRGFWLVIGADQTLHYLTYILITMYIVK